MNNQLSPYTILLLSQLFLVYILYHTSKPARQLILAQGRKAVVWTFNQARDRLHARLASLKPRRAASKETQA